MKKGFTLVELLVVVAMLMILMGSVSSSVMKARKRANIEKATAVCQELTNAILAYENYARDHKLPTKNKEAADRSSIAFLIGEGPEGENGKVPVLFNATFRGNDLLDPWGNPYRITIKESKIDVDQDDLVKKLKSGMQTGVFFPNFWRRHAGEQ